MEISRDTRKYSQKLYLNIIGSLLKEADININEIPALKLIRREPPTTQYHWTSLANLENRIFTQYFCHFDSIKIKADAKTKFGTIIKFKQTSNISSNNTTFADDFNIRIPFTLKNEEAAADIKVSSSQFKAVLNHGMQEYKGVRLSFYESFGFLRSNGAYNIKLGVISVWDQVGMDNRLKVDQDGNITLYNKLALKINKFKFGILGVLDLTRGNIASKSLYLGYQASDAQFHLKAEQVFGRRTMSYRDVRQWFSHLSLTSVYQLRNKMKVGVQISVSPQSSKMITSGVLQYISISNKLSQKYTMYKVKLDSVLTLGCVARHHYNNKFIFSIGCKIPFYDKLDTNKIGVRVDINM